MNDSASLERYRYLLRTGSPDQIEAMHVEAFGKLNPEQRERLADALAAQAQPGEAPRSSDPRDLARAATRQEIRAPGSIEAAYAATNRADSRDVGSDPQRADRSGLGFGDRDIVGAVGAGALGLIGGIVAGSVISSVVGSIFDGVDFGPEAMFGDFDGGFDL